MIKLKTLLLIAVACALIALPGAAELQVGVASVNITPDPLLPVSGGLGTPVPATEKRGELEIRAMVLATDDTRIAMVTVPCIGIPTALCDQIRALVKDVPPEGIMIGATHTHSAPDVYAFVDEKGNVTADMDYVESVVRGAAKSINDAVDALQPASLKIATGEAAEKIAFNYYAPELYDRRCDVMQAVDADGKPFATMVNYAVHPEALGPKRGILSPDIIGPLCDRIESLGGGMCVFMNGAQGGMVTADNRDVDEYNNDAMWKETVRIGHLLADEAMRIVADAPVQGDPEVWCGAMNLVLPVDNELFRMIMDGSPLDYKISEDFTVRSQLNVVNVGNAQILTIPGEALPNIGFYLKRNMHGEHNMLFGLTNDAYGYILTKEDFNSFKRYDYVTRTSLGERTWDIYADAALAFVDQAPRPKKLK